MKITKNAKNAIYIGTLCSVAYLAVYIARNILSAVTPEILEEGLLSKEVLGTLSSAYFTLYAIGQLINGIIGDKIKAVYMMSTGLLLAGTTIFIFPHFISSGVWLVVIYGMTGFFLSMIYGPMTRVVAESTEPIYAVRCSLGYIFASFLGSPVAGLFAAAFVWYDVFNLSSGILVAMAVVCFVLFLAFEKRGIIKYGTRGASVGTVAPAGLIPKIKLLIRHDIIRFSAVSMLTGVLGTAVFFWMPTYFNEHLGYSTEVSALIFTVVTLAISANSFIAIGLYELLGRRRTPALLILFGVSVIAFFLAFLVSSPIPNIIFLVLAIFGTCGASTILWSVYCPSLSDTGMVSSATGFLDFSSYIAAAVATALFGNMISIVGWSNLLLIWAGFAAFGTLVSIPWRKIQ